MGSLGGCALTLTAPDRQRRLSETPKCDTGKGLVALDGLLGATLGVASLAALGEGEPEAAAITGLIGVAFIASAVRGNRVTNECRAAFDGYSPLVVDDDGRERPRGRRPRADVAAQPDDPYRDTGGGPAVSGPAVSGTPAVATQPPVATPPTTTEPPAAPARPRPPSPADDPWSEFWTEVP